MKWHIILLGHLPLISVKWKLSESYANEIDVRQSARKALMFKDYSFTTYLKVFALVYIYLIFLFSLSVYVNNSIAQKHNYIYGYGPIMRMVSFT